MKKLFSILIMLFIFSNFAFSERAFSWEGTPTHKDITNYAAENSILSESKGDYLSNLGFTDGLKEVLKWTKEKDVKYWLQEGSALEDEGNIWQTIMGNGRFNNHFHNPLKEWESAGLDDYILFLHYSGKSSLLWAQDGEEQSTWPGGDWSWKEARDRYYLALTSTTDTERQENFARTFRGLGHQMHLIQDKAVPAHVRNDAHPFPINKVGGLHIEKWAAKKQNRPYINSFATSPNFPTVNLNKDIVYNGETLVPITEFIDTDEYDGSNPSTSPSIGLAEYTNANFFSDDTIFTEDYSTDHRHYFPYPKKSGTNLQSFIDQKLLPEICPISGDVTFHISKVDVGNNKIIDHFVKPTYHTIQDIHESYALYSRTFYLDEKCHEDYTAKLIPRAVGYSAGLLDYFFRGEMEIKKAYVRIGSGLTVSGIDFEVKNITPPLDTGQMVEPFESGSLDLSYQYIPDGQDEPVFHLVSEIYTIAGADDPINSEDVPVSVTFPADIPAKAKDLSFTLVFRGKLGNETGAVVGKTLISENSRIAFCFQPGGAGNKINIYTMLPDGSDIRPITTTSSTTPNDSLYFLRPAWSPDGTMLAFEELTCTDPDATVDNPFCRSEYFTQDIVVIDLNSDESYPNNVLTTLHLIDTDNWNYDVYLPASSPSFSPDGTKIVALADYHGLYGNLIVFDVNTGDWRYLLEFWSGIRMFPAWSPQGDKIAYNLHEESDIYTINPNGTGNTRLTDDLYWNNHPSWSPDGEWIVFLSDRDGEGYRDIWIMDKTGGNMEKILDCNPDCHRPSFSPEGLRIVFMQNMEIFTMNFNGSDTPHATPGYLDEAWPAWSPFLPEEP